MISVDYGKLDRVYAFADFLELLANPEDLQRTIENYKAASEELRTALAAKAKVDEVDAYVVAENRKLDEREAALELKESDFEKYKAEVSADLMSVADKTHKVASEAEKSATEAAELRDKLNAELAAVAKEKADLERDRASMTAISAQLNAEREALAAKAEQLKAVLA